MLERAALPLPAPLGTLKAIHLATAHWWRPGRDRDLGLATHDAALGLAARSFGVPVLGI